MTFEFRPALRDNQPLLISIAGVSSSGKTKSALRLARGMVDGDDSKIFVLDTENRRAANYAPPKGHEPTADTFAFQHGELRAPFSPEHYMEGIQAAEDAGAQVIIVDSASHLWEGEGGLQDIHDEILAREIDSARKFAEKQGWRFDEEKTADRLSMGAWKEPKARNKRLVSRLLRCNAHLIFNLRADEKLRIEKVKDGNREKTVITQPKDLPPAERWTPICEKRFPYEMTASFVLDPLRPGYPIPIKLQDQHAAFFPPNRPIDEEAGRKLAEWARGRSPTRAPIPTQESPNAPPQSPQGQPPAEQARDPEAGASAAEQIAETAVEIVTPRGETWRFALPTQRDDMLQAWDAELEAHAAGRDAESLAALWAGNKTALKAIKSVDPAALKRMGDAKDRAKVAIEGERA